MSEDLYRKGLQRQLDVDRLLRIGQLYSNVNLKLFTAGILYVKAVKLCYQTVVVPVTHVQALELVFVGIK